VGDVLSIGVQRMQSDLDLQKLEVVPADTPDLREPCISLRAEVFEVKHRRAIFADHETEADKQDSFLIVRDPETGTVYGGLTLTIREPFSDTPLKINKGGFSIDDQFPHLHPGDQRVGQITGLALAEAVRRNGLGMLGAKLLDAAYDALEEHNIDVMVGHPIVASTKRMERHANRRGCNFASFPEVEFPAKTEAREHGYDYTLLRASRLSAEDSHFDRRNYLHRYMRKKSLMPL
jgi:hypothetical protein